MFDDGGGGGWWWWGQWWWVVRCRMRGAWAGRLSCMYSNFEEEEQEEYEEEEQEAQARDGSPGLYSLTRDLLHSQFWSL